MEAEAASDSERFYLLHRFPYPLGPFLHRRTIRTEAVKGIMWQFEQERALGFSSVSTNTRMTVIKLKSGGLWVHMPIAPTRECIQLLKELDAPVEHIVLPTFAKFHRRCVGASAGQRRDSARLSQVNTGAWSPSLATCSSSLPGSRARGRSRGGARQGSLRRELAVRPLPPSSRALPRRGRPRRRRARAARRGPRTERKGEEGGGLRRPPPPADDSPGSVPPRSPSGPQGSRGGASCSS